MLDTNIFDRIVASGVVVDRLQKVVQEELLKILTTHVQEDELSLISDVEKKKKVASIPREVIPTRGFVLGVSRLGMARLGGEGIEEVRQGNIRHTHDALIAATAEGYADVLVTEDTTLRSRIRDQNLKVEVWDYERFFQHVESL